MNIQRIILLVCLGFVASIQSLSAATCDTVWPEDLSSNHATTLDGLTFLGGSSLSHTGGTTNFSATDYHYTTANITGGDLNATGGSSTRLFFNGSVSISGQADINYPGDPEDMVIFINGSLTVTGQADINAVIYVTGAVSLSGQADITGAVTALGGGSQSGQAAVVYDSDAIDLVDMGQTCINSASYTDPELYYGGPACGSTNQIVVAFDNSSDKQTLDNSTVTNTSNYQVSLVGGGSVSVSSVAYSSASKMATLTLGSSMGSLSQYQVSLSNIQDTDGRTISASSDTFRFYDNSGLVGEYYQNDSLSGTATVSFDSTVDKSYSPLWWLFGWHGGPWPFGSGVDEFSIRWKGWVKPSSTGSYQFQTKSDDGVRLWVDDVNGTKIIDNWTAHSETTDTASAMSLVEDTYYPIKLEYNNQETCVWIFCSQTDGEMHLRWITPGATNQVIPSGNLSTCIAPPPTNTLDHFRISHGDNGVTCEAELVTIEAWGTDGNLMTDYTGTISISTSTNNGDWLSVAGANGTFTAAGSDVGTASYIFHASDQGSVELSLQNTHAETTNIDVLDGVVNESASEDNDLTFSDTGFRFYAGGVYANITTQIAGKPSSTVPGNQTVTLRGVETNSDTGACQAALTGATTVGFAYECNNPTSCFSTTSLLSVSSSSTYNSVGAVDAGINIPNYASLELTFDANGEAPISFVFSDAGQVTLHAEATVTPNSPDPEFTLEGNSNAFVSRPFGFDIDFGSADREADWIDGGSLDGDTYATNEDGSVYLKAGETFLATVTARVWDSADDTDENGIPDEGANLTNNVSTKNFGNEAGGINVGISHSLIQPSSGGDAGVLSADAIVAGGVGNDFSNGAATSNMAWDEVGIIDINATLSDYLGDVNADVQGVANDVGRFTPDHFVLSASVGGYSNGCSAVTPFTYIGQPFTFGVSDLPEITVTPKNGAGATVVNYFGVFKKLSVNSLTRSMNLVSGNIGVDGNPLTVTASYALPTLNLEVSPTSDAVYEYATVDNFTYDRSTNAMANTFTVNLPLIIDSVIDGDGITTSSSFTFTPSGSLAGDETSQRFGRLRLENAFGPETSALIVPINAEYFDGSDFILNADDGCSTIAEADFDLNVAGGVDPSAGDFTGIAIGGSTTTGSIGNSTFVSGTADFSFSAPGAGSTGEIAVQVDVSGVSWLLYDWDGVDQGGDLDFLDDFPSSTAIFGRYRAHDKIIYWREVGN